MIIPTRVAGQVLVAAVVLSGLYLARLYHYLLFHSLVELFAVLVACGIFVIAWNTRRIASNNYLLFFGIASLFVGFVDLLHALAYKGMGAFPDHDANLPTQFWIVARYLQGSALVAAPLLLDRKLRPWLVLVSYLALTFLLLLSIFTGVFPACFIEPEGLTPFKKVSEYLIALMMAAALFLMLKKKDRFDPGVVRLLCLGGIVFVFSELSFTLYTDVYGMSNLLGHLLKLLGFVCLYKAIIETGLVRPYSILFRELKQNQEEVETLNTELSDRAASLQKVNAELEAANQELETFNYTVSHDLRGPLTVINGYAQLLLTKNKMDEETTTYIRKIWEGGSRMSGLIGTLLDFSRLGRGQISHAEVNLSRIAEQVAMELRLRSPGRDVAFTIQDDVRVEGDKQLLQVLMSNLLENAWKYSANVEHAVVEFGTTEAQDERWYYVRDNGAGFDIQKADILFLPFKRLHDEADFEGMGIGLATVKRIVGRHGGRIWAESAPGKGSTFYFTLAPSPPKPFP